jgi:hypothetical protein
MSNPFEAWSEKNKPAHEKRRERIAQKRNEALEARQKEKAELAKLYKIAAKEERAKVLEGAYAERFIQLFKVLDNLGMGGGRALLDFLRAQRWHETPPEVRFQVLQYVDRAAIAVRERAGLPPFDDPLPWDPGRPFVQHAKEVLGETS